MQPKTARPNVETLGYYHLSLRDGFQAFYLFILNVVVADLRSSEPPFISSTRDLTCVQNILSFWQNWF